jgi:hypothetical protein
MQGVNSICRVSFSIILKKKKKRKERKQIMIKIQYGQEKKKPILMIFGLFEIQM